MKKLIALLVVTLISINLSGQIPPGSLSLYNKGVELFKQGNYVAADSLFSEALKLFEFPDAYYNRALTSLKLGSMKNFCINIKSAGYLGDMESFDEYKRKCTSTDTIYRDAKDMICRKSVANYYEIVSVWPYESSMSYTKFVNDSAIIGYLVKERDTIYTTHPDIKMPQFLGGEEGLLRYLSSNIRYPRYARENGISGKAYASFYIDQYGKVNDVHILRGLSMDINIEVLRVIRSMPNWIPASIGGRNVGFYFNVPVNFNLR